MTAWFPFFALQGFALILIGVAIVSALNSLRHAITQHGDRVVSAMDRHDALLAEINKRYGI